MHTALPLSSSEQMFSSAQTKVGTTVSKHERVTPEAVPVDWTGQEEVVMEEVVLHCRLDFELLPVVVPVVLVAVLVPVVLVAVVLAAVVVAAVVVAAAVVVSAVVVSAVVVSAVVVAAVVAAVVVAAVVVASWGSGAGVRFIYNIPWIPRPFIPYFSFTCSSR